MSTKWNEESSFISAVVYLTTGYADITQSFLTKLTHCFNNMFQYSEIIFVDDHCQDGATDIIRAFSQQYSSGEISIVTMSCFQGREKAMRAGVDLAIGDFVFEFESLDMDYDPELIADVYKMALEGFDIVSAVQNTKPQVSSRLFYGLYNHFSDAPYPVERDVFRVLSRRAINRVQSLNSFIPLRNAAYASCGLKKAVKRYTPTNGDKRTSSGSGGHKGKLETAITALSVYTNFSLKISYAIDGLTMLAVLMYLLLCCFHPAVSFSWGTFTLMVIGILIELLVTLAIHSMDILIKLVFNEQDYIFESVEKLTR